MIDRRDLPFANRWYSVMGETIGVVKAFENRASSLLFFRS
jgi:hypothetical protein